MARDFHGKAYLYQTSEGIKPIGVCSVLGGLWAVAWITASGSRRRIKSKGLPVMAAPAKLQPLLDQWAALHKLEEVK